VEEMEVVEKVNVVEAGAMETAEIMEAA